MKTQRSKMGVLSTVRALFSPAGRQRLRADAVFYRDPRSGFALPGGWSDAFQDTGVTVTPEIAMSVSAIWAGVTFMARNMASMPLDLFIRTKVNGHPGKEKDREHRLYPTLRWSPNRVQTAKEFQEMGMGHVLLRGNFISRIIERPGGIDLLPMHPDRIRIETIPNGELRYVDVPSGDKFLMDEIHHVRGFSSDGKVGLSLVEVAARSIGSAVTQEKYAARFFSTGASASISISAPPEVFGDDETVETLHKSVKNYMSGLDNVGGVLIIPAGATIDTLGINPVEAALLPSREHVVREVARWLGLPTQVLADAGKEPTHASATAFAQQLVSEAFRPMAVRFEQAMMRDLLTPAEKRTHFVNFNMDHLLRGDMKARGEFYRVLLMVGAITPNEIRSKENMNAGPEELDKFQKPLNMGFIDDPANPQAAAPAGGQNTALEMRFGVRATALATAAGDWIVIKELDAIERLAKKNVADGKAWAEDVVKFYERHAVTVSERLRIPIQVAREYAAEQGTKLLATGIAQTETWRRDVPPRLAALALRDYDEETGDAK